MTLGRDLFHSFSFFLYLPFGAVSIYSLPFSFLNSGYYVLYLILILLFALAMIFYYFWN